MKKALLVFALLACLPPARAQEPSALNLRLEPHFLILTEAVLDAQFRVGDHFSLGPTVSYMIRGNGVFVGWKVSDRLFYSDKTERLGLGLRAAWYLSGVDVHSFYVAPFAKVLWNKVESSYDGSRLFLTSAEPERSGKFRETDVGVTFGYQWVLRSLTFNAGAGIARYWFPDSLRLADSNGGNAYDYRLTTDKVGLQIDAGMGFRF